MSTPKPEGPSPDEIVEAAGQVTEKESATARELEEQGRFSEAAVLYDRIAAAWRQAAVMVTGDRQSSFQSLADYWAERANAARQRAAEESAPVSQARDSQPLSKAVTLVHDASVQSARSFIKRPGSTEEITRGPTREPSPTRRGSGSISRR